MRSAHATLVITLWLSAVLYWNASQCVASHKIWECHVQSYCCTIIVTNKTEVSKELDRMNGNANNQTQDLGRMHVNEKQTDSLAMSYANAEFLGRFHTNCLYVNIDKSKLTENLYVNKTKLIGRLYTNGNNQTKLLARMYTNIDYETKNLGSMYTYSDKQTKNSFLIVSSLQGPLIYKWRREWSRSKTQITKIQYNKVVYVCRMAFSRNLEKSLDGVQDMEVTQTKKRSSSNACLTIVEKTKNKSHTQGKTYPLWLGFKAMNALNISKGLAIESHRSVSDLVKNGMYEDEALECQNCVTAYPYVLQELWPNKYKK